MLKVTCCGVGNAGSQTAALAVEELGIDGLCINTSQRDIDMVKSEKIKKLLVGDANGAGKERSLAKKFLKESIMKLLDDDEIAEIFNSDVLFIISSAGGGTGSGMSVLLANIVGEVYPNTKVIIVGILPALTEALSSQLNAVEYMNELYTAIDGATYMLYDNDVPTDKELTEPEIFDAINKNIVNDIDVIRGTYQYPTRFSSIDERDMSNIISTRGRIVIASLNNIKEKDVDKTTIEQMLINELKTGNHAEFQRDLICHRTGIICNLSEKLMGGFSTQLPEVQKVIGVPVEAYTHVCVNNDREVPNSVHLIVSGLTQVNDRIRKINDRIDEINERQKQIEDDSELNGIDFDEMSSKIERRKVVAADDGNVDLKSIFGKFGI
jgi:cell division GTPase FtsZ